MNEETSVADEMEHDLRISWYQLQVDKTRPGLSIADASYIAAEKARIAARMRQLGIEVPPSIDEAPYG